HALVESRQDPLERCLEIPGAELPPPVSGAFPPRRPGVSRRPLLRHFLAWSEFAPALPAAADYARPHKREPFFRRIAERLAAPRRTPGPCGKRRLVSLRRILIFAEHATNHAGWDWCRHSSLNTPGLRRSPLLATPRCLNRRQGARFPL